MERTVSTGDQTPLAAAQTSHLGGGVRVDLGWLLQSADRP